MRSSQRFLSCRVSGVSMMDSTRMRSLSCGACVAASVLLVSCSSAPSSGTSSRNPRSLNDTDAAVIAGWKAAFNAYDAAARTANWQSPRLAGTFLEPLLSDVQGTLRGMQAHAEVAVGTDQIAWVKVVSVSSSKASILACVQGDELVVERSNNRPVSGPLGEAGPESARAMLVKTLAGWEVSEQTVTEGPCPATAA